MGHPSKVASSKSALNQWTSSKFVKHNSFSVAGFWNSYHLAGSSWPFLQGFPWLSSIGGVGGDTLHPEKHSETPQIPQRDALCVEHLYRAALPITSHTDELHSSPNLLLLWPSCYCKPGGNYTTEGWSEKTCGPSTPLLESRVHLCLKPDQKAGPHCHSPPPLYLKWVCPLLPVNNAMKCQLAKSKFLCIYIYLEYCWGRWSHYWMAVL